MNNNSQPQLAEKAYSISCQNMVKSNYSERSVDAMFLAEVNLQDAYDNAAKYSGMNAEQKQSAMQHEYNEIAACNDVYDYYND